MNYAHELDESQVIEKHGYYAQNLAVSFAPSWIKAILERMDVLERELKDGNDIAFVELDEYELARYFRREIFGYDLAMIQLGNLRTKILASGTDGRASPMLFLPQYIPYSDEPPIDYDLA